MKHPVKTLAALAILGVVAPSAHAVSIKDDVVSMKLGGNIQFRASLLNDAQTDSGADYDPLRNQTGQSAEFARFDIRRARLSFAAKMGDWSGNITLRSEKNDNAAAQGGAAPSANVGRQVQLYYAKIARDFKVGDMTHQIRLGLDKSFHAESTQSSSTFMFPTDTIVSEKVEERGVGVGYMFMLPFLNLGLDLHNNSTGVKDVDSADVNFGETNGYFYSGRIEFAPGADFMPAKRMESFYGKEGTHLVIGFDIQVDTGSMSNNNVAANTWLSNNVTNGTYVKTDTTTWGPDALFHWNGLTAKAEWRQRIIKADTTNTGTGVTTSANDLVGTFWDIQAGYAFPTEEVVIEPAVGYMVNNSNTAAFTNPYGNGTDNGADGNTINLGVNFYWNGHDNKTQVAFQSWKAEEGNADAKIIRIQHQINF